MKKKLVRSILLAVLSMFLMSAISYAATPRAVSVCPRCGSSSGTYSSPKTSTYHTTRCGSCGTSYQQNHYWVTEGITYCSKCGWY